MSANAPEVHFDRIAGRYDAVPETWRSVYDRARLIIEPIIRDKTILDVGSGGFFPYDTGLAKKIIALDVSQGMLERIRVPGIDKIQTDARSMTGVTDESVDVVLFVQSLHHMVGRSVCENVESLDRIFGSCRRVLRKGGRLVIVEPFFGNFFFGCEKALYGAEVLLFGLMKVPPVFFYTSSLMKKRLAAAFSVSEKSIATESLPIKGWVDPMGGTFPGRVKIPAWLCPTRYYCLVAEKR